MNTPANSVLLKLAIEADDPQAAVARAALQGGWEQQQVLPADAEHGLEIIWLHVDTLVELHFVQDDMAGQAYIALLGKDEAVAAQAAALRVVLPLTDLAEVLRRDRQSLDATGLARLPGLLAVLGPPDYDGAVMHALADLLAVNDANTRLRTLTAIASLGWPELRPLVMAAAVADAEDFVRWRAADLLAAYENAARR